MPTFAMKCSVCDETFDLERAALPVREKAPRHAPVYPDQPRLDIPCAGSGQAMMPPSR